MRMVLVGMLSALVLGACAPTVNLPIDPLGRTFCGRGVGLEATLHGSASDSRVAWAIDTRSGQRFELVWPPGYRARFTPQLAVLDGSGAVVGHEGDRITGGCNSVTDPAAPMWVSGSEIE
jgi:hypothetical protein